MSLPKDAKYSAQVLGWDTWVHKVNKAGHSNHLDGS